LNPITEPKTFFLIELKAKNIFSCFTTLLACFLFVVTTLPSWAERGEIIGNKSKLLFYGNSNIHSFQGDIGEVKGFIYGDSKDIKSVNYFQLEFNSNEFSTNNTARDENLKKMLFVKQYPNIKFVSTNVTISHDGALADITGRLTIRNISQRVVFTAYLTKPAPKEVRARGSFWIKLSDFNLQPPAPAFIRVNNKVQIKFDAVSTWVR
jgi:polyisoprenoid-binding protein YceI